MVLWLRQMAHDQEVVGSNPGNVYWMDVSYHIKENGIKGSQIGRTKKLIIIKDDVQNWLCLKLLLVENKPRCKCLFWS